MIPNTSLVQGLGRGNALIEGQYINTEDIEQKCCDAPDPGSGFGVKTITQSPRPNYTTNDSMFRVWSHSVAYCDSSAFGMIVCVCLDRNPTALTLSPIFQAQSMIIVENPHNLLRPTQMLVVAAFEYSTTYWKILQFQTIISWTVRLQEPDGQSSLTQNVSPARTNTLSCHTQMNRENL
jgi:hypothetical protein